MPEKRAYPNRSWVVIGTVMALWIGVKQSVGGTLNMERIEGDLKVGKLSAETALLYEAYSVLAPERVPPVYRTEGLNKCGTGTLVHVLGQWGMLGSTVRSTLSGLLRRPELRYAYPSQSGRFRIHYDTEGMDGVDRTDRNGDGIPDVVELAAAYFDSAYVLEVKILGYQEPVRDEGGEDGAWDVYMRELSRGPMPVYGYANPERQVGEYSYTSFVEIDNGFSEEGVYRTLGEDALKITAAHEFFHMIQLSYCGLGGIEWWMEASATWMEDVAYDEVNDYYHSLGFPYNPYNTPFTHPEQALDRRDHRHEYGACVFAHYLSERLDRDVIREIWEDIGSSGQVDMRPFDRVVGKHILGGLGIALPEFYVWNYFTGDRARPERYYEEGAHYPLVRIAHEHSAYPAEGKGSVEHLGATYIRFDAPPDSALEGLSVRWFEGEDAGAWEERLVRVCRTQEVEVEVLIGGQAKVDNWSHYGDVVLVGVVTNHSGFCFPYAYIGEQVDSSFGPPSVMSLDPPYPNPFLLGRGQGACCMPAMTIPFGLTKAVDVVISVYTMDGVLVREFPLGMLGAQHYGDRVRWDGRNAEGVLVGSGMYVVQMDAGGFQTRRMVAVVR